MRKQLIYIVLLLSAAIFAAGFLCPKKAAERADIMKARAEIMEARAEGCPTLLGRVEGCPVARTEGCPTFLAGVESCPVARAEGCPTLLRRVEGCPVARTEGCPKALTRVCPALFSTLRPARVKGRVEIEGISVRGKTEGEALSALSPLLREWEGRTLTLILPNGKGLTVASPHIAVTTDFTKVWQRALQIKKGESASLSLTPTFSLPDFFAISKEIAREFYLAPKDAVLTFSPNANPLFSVSSEHAGRRVDEYLLIKRVLAALPALKTEKSVAVSVPLKTLFPAVTRKELEGRHATLATFSTRYGGSLAERKHNVMLAASKLHGVTLAPGESLSFNSRVGERTEENGFLKAKVIERGAFTEGVGGGVCQVSGTLYNAAVLSGLTVTEYHQHSLAVSYLPPSRDAMVNYGTADLVIRNDFAHPVFLTARADGERLSFTFYGAPTGKTYALESEVTGSIPAPEPLLEQDDGTLFPDLSAGERKVIQREKEGMLSACYLLVTENGKTTKTLLRKNKYLPVRGHVILGGALPKNAPSQTVSPTQSA